MNRKQTDQPSSGQDVTIPAQSGSSSPFQTADAIPGDAGAADAASAGAIDKEEQPLEADAGRASGPATAVGPQSAPQPAPGVDRRPSVLYCVPANVLDITSGAALSQRTLLMSLAARGFRVTALEATVFDSPQGGEHVLKAGEQHKDKKMLRAVTNGVEHLMIRTQAVRRGEMTCIEQEIYIKAFRDHLQHHRPDFVFMWGGMLLEMTMMREAHEADVPVVFYLVNGGYKNKETFKYVDVVVTDTAATARLYKERMGLDCQVVGKFIDPGLFKAKVPRRPDFITFINPSFEKGVSLFMPLAKLAAEECPEVRFLVVQSRGRWGNALQVLKYVPQDFPNVKVIGHQQDMRPVYASSRALLLPSYWHESGARVIAEAQLNGVPIVASNTGGSAELIGQGGVILEIPEEVREKDRGVRAPDEVVRPWLEEVKRLWRDAAYYDSLCRNVEKEALQHDLGRNTERFLQAVGPAVTAAKRAHAAKATGAAAATGSTSTSGALRQALAAKQQKTRQKQQGRRRAG
jgi:glycosyltransferase involved in cell wall biosynthesis